MRGDSSSPTRLGTYRLEKLLGRGGMGEVFLAWDERLERHVALKRILGDPPPDARARTRFRREARAVARLNHPAIVQVFELLEAEGDDCLVMEYVAGQGLIELIATGGLDLDQILRLAAEIADGLAEAHGKGLVHRDLKPENVRVTASGHAKILDFGLARLLWGEGGDRDSRQVTQSGALVGTVHAMSPEQASGRTVDHRSDLFAFGSLLYEMLSGRAPFRGQNVLDTLRRVTSEAPTPLSALRPDLAPELVALVESLQAKEPGDRPQNARLVTDTLERLRAAAASSPEATGAASGAPPSAPILPVPGPSAPRPGSVGAAIEDLPTGEWPQAAAGDSTTETAVRTLLVTDLVASTQLLASLGDARASAVFEQHDRMARDLLASRDGVEIDRTDGFLFLFERPFAAVAFALAYHRQLTALSRELSVELIARVGVHLGEVRLRRNAPQDVSRGAKPLEVEGLAKPTAARLMALAAPHQTLLTASAFEVARQAAKDEEGWDEGLRWLAHGSYHFAGLEEPVEVFEVGEADVAPLRAPPDSENAQRAVSASEEQVLGWRPAPGQTVPRRPSWQLEARLGEGAFGEVWRAGHASGEKRLFKFCFEASRLRTLQREVAFFRLLKEALGRRDDIARLLDWSFDEAPFYLEAEYSEEGDLATWAAQQGGIDQLPLDTRLELVAQVCEALAAAHSVAVLHNDLRPANILVARDGEGQPRALLGGFDVAEDARPSEPRYAAPEVLEGEAPTVQSDLYALGVILYQMVVGDLSRVLAPGWQRDVSDEILVADIARIVDRAPQRRPPGAFEIADRLRRLEERRAEGQARQEARATRRALARSQRRRRYLAGLAAALLIVAAVLAFQQWRMTQEAARANRERETARQVTEFMVGLFAVADPGENPGATLTARDLLDRGSETLDHRLQDRPELRAVLMSTLGRVYGNLGDYETALPLLEQAVDQLDDGAEQAPQRAASLHELAKLRFARSDYPAALDLYNEALALRRQALGDQHPDVAVNLNDLGLALLATGDEEGAERALREALAINRQRFGEEHRSVAAGLHNLARVHEARGDTAGAEQLLRQALDIQRRVLGELHPDVAASLNNLGVFLYHRGERVMADGLLRQALAQKRRIFGDLHPEVAAGLNNLAVLRRDEKGGATSRQLYEEALAIYRRVFGDRHEHVGKTLVNLALLELEQGDLPKAEALSREAAQRFPAGHWRIAQAESVLGACLTAQERFPEAETLLTRSHAALQAQRGADAAVTREARERLVALYGAWGRPDDAAPYRPTPEPP